MFPLGFFGFPRLIIPPLLFTPLEPPLEVYDNPDQSECCHIHGLWDFMCDVALGWLHTKEVALRTAEATSQGKKAYAYFCLRLSEH